MKASELLGVCVLFLYAGSSDGAEVVSVPVSVEGDPVTLNTDVTVTPQQRIKWYFNDSLIAQIIRGQSYTCTDDECKERFRDRLKLNNQTGSLTIMNITNTDSGDYTLKNTSRNTDNIFSVTVQGVSAAERDDMKRKSVKEGESVTLDTRVIKNPNDVMRWYFNNISIAEITGDQSEICSDDECKERFRDRLKLDHQTGSLTIMNITNTDSGEYTLKNSSSRCSIIRSFTVTVTYVSDSGSSSAAAVVVVAAVVLVVVVVLLLFLLVAAVVFYKRKAIMKCTGRKRSDPTDDARDTSCEQTNALMKTASNGTSHNETEAADETQL